jgi:hypothetical protein
LADLSSRTNSVAKNPKTYQRLPGAGTRGFHRVRLWQGPDHLLFVASSALGERYKRFYFADIQAIVMLKTAQWLGWMIALLAATAIFGLAGVEITDATGRIVMLSITGVFFLILLIHAAFGPTCRCTIRTAVQTEELPSLKRLRNADKVLARIRPLIESAQRQENRETQTPI